jgi:hypothetical protein
LDVTRNRVWEPWLLFMLQAVEGTAHGRRQRLRPSARGSNIPPLACANACPRFTVASWWT